MFERKYRACCRLGNSNCETVAQSISRRNICDCWLLVPRYRGAMHDAILSITQGICSIHHFHGLELTKSSSRGGEASHKRVRALSRYLRMHDAPAAPYRRPLLYISC